MSCAQTAAVVTLACRRDAARRRSLRRYSRPSLRPRQGIAAYPRTRSTPATEAQSRTLVCLRVSLRVGRGRASRRTGTRTPRSPRLRTGWRTTHPVADLCNYAEHGENEQRSDECEQDQVGARRAARTVRLTRAAHGCSRVESRPWFVPAAEPVLGRMRSRHLQTRQACSGWCSTRPSW